MHTEIVQASSIKTRRYAVDKKYTKKAIRSIIQELRAALPNAQKISVKVVGEHQQAVGKIELRCLQKSFYSKSIGDNIHDALEGAKELILSQVNRQRRHSFRSSAYRRVHS